MPYYRRNIYVLSVTIFLGAVSWNQIVPFLPLFLKEIGAGDKLGWWIGAVFAAQAVGSMVGLPLWGKLGDTRGRKRMILRAGVCVVSLYFAMSFCNAPWQLLVLRFLNGFLSGFIPASIALIATNTPEPEAPRCVAMAHTASAAGYIVGPAVGGLLASQVGYRGSMQISGFAVLLSVLVVLLLVVEPNKVRHAEKTSMLADFGVALRSPIQLALILAVMISWTFGQAINPYLPIHLKNLASVGGSTPDWLVGAIFALPAAALFLFAQRWTRLGEKWRFERVIVLGMIGLGISSIALSHISNMWAFAALYFVAGAWLAAVTPSIAALVVTRVDEPFRGRAFGIQQSAGMLAALISVLGAGLVSEFFGTRAIFTTVGIVLLLGTVLFHLRAKAFQVQQDDEHDSR